MKKVGIDLLGPTPKFQVNIKIQLNAARDSRLSFRFLLWLQKILWEVHLGLHKIFDSFLSLVAFLKHAKWCENFVPWLFCIIGTGNEVDDLSSAFVMNTHYPLKEASL